MMSKQEVVNALRATRLLDLLEWAAPAAFAITESVYDESVGHDQGVVGYLNFKHLRDLMDRASGNGRFLVDSPSETPAPDVLELGLTRDAFLTMPAIPRGAIERRDYRQSPGWAAGGVRLLLQAYRFGEVDEIRWADRSDAKRRVANQVFDRQATLFDAEELGLEYIAGIPDGDDFVGVTLVAAHAFDPATRQHEVFVGQSRNPLFAGDGCWHWRVPVVASAGAGIAASRQPSLGLPGEAASIMVGDVEVRMRERTGEASGRRAHG